MKGNSNFERSSLGYITRRAPFSTPCLHGASGAPSPAFGLSKVQLALSSSPAPLSEAMAFFMHSNPLDNLIQIASNESLEPTLMERSLL